MTMMNKPRQQDDLNDIQPPIEKIVELKFCPIQEKERELNAQRIYGLNWHENLELILEKMKKGIE